VHVGHHGVTDAVRQSLDDNLRTHELVKIQFTSAAVQMFWVTLCTVVVALYITRMTKTSLRAIELTSNEPPE